METHRPTACCFSKLHQLQTALSAASARASSWAICSERSGCSGTLPTKILKAPDIKKKAKILPLKITACVQSGLHMAKSGSVWDHSFNVPTSSFDLVLVLKEPPFDLPSSCKVCSQAVIRCRCWNGLTAVDYLAGIIVKVIGIRFVRDLPGCFSHAAVEFLSLWRLTTLFHPFPSLYLSLPWTNLCSALPRGCRGSFPRNLTQPGQSFWVQYCFEFLQLLFKAAVGPRMTRTQWRRVRVQCTNVVGAYSSGCTSVPFIAFVSCETSWVCSGISTELHICSRLDQFNTLNSV